MKTYGLPYKGSKDKIADKICSLFPIIEHRSIICANENQSVIERVFLPNHQVKDYTIPSIFDMM